MLLVQRIHRPSVLTPHSKVQKVQKVLEGLQFSICFLSLLRGKSVPFCQRYLVFMQGPSPAPDKWRALNIYVLLPPCLPWGRGREGKSTHRKRTSAATRTARFMARSVWLVCPTCQRAASCTLPADVSSWDRKDRCRSRLHARQTIGEVCL